MPVVTVEMWEGRTIEQKKQLVEGITSVMTNMGISLRDSSNHHQGYPQAQLGNRGQAGFRKY